MAIFKAEEWNVDLDRYVNPFLPPPQLHRLPTPISRFLGYRKEQKQDIGNVLGAFWSCVGAFCGLAVIAAVFNNTASIQERHPPALIASFGASAILEYNSIRASLGQPRNAVFGHTISALIGVGITKLFLFHSEFQRIRWTAGAVSCGVASAAMLLTGTVHPPGGASAVLAATDGSITEMGWGFVPLVMLGTVLMVLVGLITNNIQRQFPMYWWTPLDLRKGEGDIETVPDAKGAVERKIINEDDGHESSKEINISAAGVSLPADLSLNQDEAELLQALRHRLKKMKNQDGERRASSSSSTECTMVPSQGARSSSDASAFFH